MNYLTVEFPDRPSIRKYNPPATLYDLKSFAKNHLNLANADCISIYVKDQIQNLNSEYDYQELLECSGNQVLVVDVDE